MKIRGVDFVMFRVSDLSRAVKFYRDVLGLPLEMHNEEFRWAEFDCGDTTLALNGGEPVSAAGRGARLAFAVDDIDAAYRELESASVPGLQPPQDFGVCRAFEVTDPDGNSILLHRRADGTFGRHAAQQATANA